MTLAIDFTESLSGTTLTVTLTLNSGFSVDTFTLYSLDYDQTIAQYVSTSFNAVFNSTSDNAGAGGSVSLAGIASSGSLASGGVLATITFTMLGGATTLPLTNIEGELTEPPNAAPNTGASGTHPDVPCFAEGTLIRTSRGDIAVEALRPGDKVLTIHPDGWSTITWIGERQVDCLHHPRPHDVNPILLRRDAVAPGRPDRDLKLSPDHAVFLRGRLVPARHLLNGATILQVAAARIRYFHVELARHAVLLAQGLPVESYLDTGNRAAFANGGAAVMAHADFSRGIWATRSCAKLVTGGAELAAIRHALLARAEALGHVDGADPALRLLVDGALLLPHANGATLCFDLPPASRDIRLLSRSAVPAQHESDSPDHRRLGIAVAAITADGVALDLTDPRLAGGWHAAEPGWRWTDGEAHLALPGTRRLRIDVALTRRYWIDRRALDRAA